MSEQKRRRRFTVEQKAAILRRHLVDKLPVSDLCEEYGLQPSVFYGWQRQLLENLEVALDTAGGRRATRRDARLETENQQLRARLAHKDGVIAEISEEYVALKKALGEP